MAGAVLLSHASIAVAQVEGVTAIPWKIQTGLGVTETYSSNINLLPSGQEKSDFVTSISPSLGIRRRGPKLDVNFSYSPEALYYARNSNGSTVRNSLNGTAKAEIINDNLFFDVNAQISQQNTSPFGALAANSVNGSSNRTETRTLTFGPYFRSTFGNDGSYLIGYRFARNDSDTDVISLNKSNQFYASASGSAGLSNFRWGLNYDRQNSNYANLNDQKAERASITLSYLFDSRLTFFVTSGQERNDYVTFTDEASDGSYYSAGFQWIPSPTTSLDLQHGKRYFGNTDQIQFTHRTPNTIWRLGYTRDQATSVQQLALPANFSNAVLLDSLFQSRFPDPVARGQAIATLLQQSAQPSGQIQQFNFLTNQVYLQKRFDLSVLLVGLRNTVNLTFSKSEQKALSAETIPLDIFALDRRLRQTVFGANWNHRLGVRTSVSLNGQHVRSETLDGSDESRQRSLTLAMQRQLQRNVSATILLRNTHQEGTFPGSDYSENAIVGSLQVQF